MNRTLAIILMSYVSGLPDRSRMLYGFEGAPPKVRVGKEEMDTHTFRMFCNRCGVILTCEFGF